MTTPKKKAVVWMSLTDMIEATRRAHARCKYLAMRLLVLLLLKLLFVGNVTGFDNLHFYFLAALAVASTVGPCEVLEDTGKSSVNPLLSFLQDPPAPQIHLHAEGKGTPYKLTKRFWNPLVPSITCTSIKAVVLDEGLTLGSFINVFLKSVSLCSNLFLWLFEC